jgi:hypothetical protein
MAHTHPGEPQAGQLPARDADTLLDHIFARLCGNFDPIRTLGEEGIFHYEVLTSDGTRDRYVIVADGACVVTRTVDRPATTTITIGLADLLRIAVGEITGSEVFRGGRLKISGDVYFSMNWRDWFAAG